MEGEKKIIRDIIETSYLPDGSEDGIDDYCEAKMMQIIKNLHDIRNQRNLSLAQLADKADVTANYLYKMEKCNCNISVKVFLKLCKALEVKVSDVVPEDDSNQDVSAADVFAYLTKDMSVKEQNAALEVLRICKGFKTSK